MYLCLILLIICMTTLTLSASRTRHEVLAQLLKDYDPNVYPNDKEGTQTEATVQMTISDIGRINDRTEEIDLTLYLRIAWHDPRLRFENFTDINFTSIELTGDKVDKLWMPDLFFFDERNANSHGIMGNEKLIYIYPDGYISFSGRITMTTECKMNFEYYPFDTQKCILHLESYAYTTNSLILKWAPINEAVQNLDSNTPNFRVTDIEITSGINTWSSFSIYKETRYFSFLNATLYFTRKSDAYGFIYFGTYPFYLSLAFLSFGLKDTSPRFTSVTTAAAGIAIQWIAIYGNLPPTEHFTVLDRWILMHMLLIWFVIVYHVGFHVLATMKEGELLRFDHVDDKSKIVPTESTVSGQGNTANQRDSEATNHTIDSPSESWSITLSDFADDCCMQVLSHTKSDLEAIRDVVLKANGDNMKCRQNYSKYCKIDNGVKRSFDEVYYLQTYLKAKYPCSTWPSLPLQHVLTRKDQLDLKDKLEEYIKNMKKLLVPEFWKKPSGISEKMNRFCKPGQWKDGKVYSCLRMYIVLRVDTAGRETAPDSLAFIVFLISYGIAIPLILGQHVVWTAACPLVALLLSISLYIIKYRKMRPQILWDSPRARLSPQTDTADTSSLLVGQNLDEGPEMQGDEEYDLRSSRNLQNRTQLSIMSTKCPLRDVKVISPVSHVETPIFISVFQKKLKEIGLRAIKTDVHIDNPNGPSTDFVIVICYNTLEESLVPDVERSLSAIRDWLDCQKIVILVILHTTDSRKSDLPIAHGNSKNKLEGKSVVSGVYEIVDIVYSRSKGIYDHPINEEAFQSMNRIHQKLP